MRAARKYWLLLVVVGCLFVFLSIASSLAALSLPSWVKYSCPVDNFPTERGLFMCRIANAMSTISSPLVKDSCDGCSADDNSKFNIITSLRLSDWAIQIVAVGIDVCTGFGGIIYLIRVRYCMKAPSAQRAQVCLCVCGFFMWLSAVLKSLGNILFTLTLTYEALFQNIQTPPLYGVYGSLSEENVLVTDSTIGQAMILMWVSVSAILLASLFWLVASFVQAPAHIGSIKPIHFTSSTNPLFSTQKSLNRS